MIIFYSGYGRPFPEIHVPDAPVMLSYWTSVYSRKAGKIEKRMVDMLAGKKAKRLAQKKAPTAQGTEQRRPKCKRP